MKTTTILLAAALSLLTFGAGAGPAADAPPFAPGSPGPGAAEAAAPGTFGGVVPSPLPIPDTVSRGIRTVALDAGHGGKEPGAVGKSGTLEKEFTLGLVAKVAKALADAGYRVVLTRENDYFVGLRERTALANAAGADLFLSLHGNASVRPDISGIETYYVSFAASDAEAQALASKENASLEASGGAGPARSGLEAILWDMAQTESVNESAEFAARLQKKLAGALGGRDRGTRQAPLIVLLGARMPAVLVEAGYISNAEEELRIKGQEFGDKFAQATVQAVGEYGQILLSCGAPARASSTAGVPTP
jgi:N-acetylmuramoyl-L-alanine amidase